MATIHYPTPEQAKAADPSASVWVSAAAGTGKTRVLTERVLRLLLKGVEPSQILCITFTNAAAAEMAQRVRQKLQSWATASEADLRTMLKVITGQEPNDALCRRARCLFAALIDQAQGVQMLTIHSFCQSLLQRFPLEAGILPGFTLMDEQAQNELIRQAQHHLWQQLTLASDEESHIQPLAEHMHHLASAMHDTTFDSLMGEALEHRSIVEYYRAHPEALDSVRAAVAHQLQVPEEDIDKDWREEWCKAAIWQDKGWRQLLACWRQEKSKGWKQSAATLQQWLDASADERVALIPLMQSLFITQKQEPKARLYPPSYEDNHSHEAALMRQALDDLLSLLEQEKARVIACNSHALMVCATALLQQYESLKRRTNVLDYDDVLYKTKALLEGESKDWVRYKLDHQITHLLIDEAQDTNPLQWDIASALLEELFAGQGEERSVFVVGDIKQSIYRFQGADPEAYRQMRHIYAEQSQMASIPWQDIPLTQSFRTSAPVLTLVDHLFSAEEHYAALGEASAVRHHVHRKDDAGKVVCWPLLQVPPTMQPKQFQLPDHYEEHQQLVDSLAEWIAGAIRQWLEAGRELPARGRAIRPDDILILVQKRTSMTPALVRALMREGVPVSGSDRIRLNEHIAVEDLLALGDWILLPEDDLTLASILKSPLCEVSEDELYTLAYGRGELSLWSRLQGMAEERWQTLTRRLEQWQTWALEGGIEALFTHIIDDGATRQRFATRMGEEVQDVLDEFLQRCQQFEQEHPPILPHFLAWMRSEEREVKRHMADMQGVVRIMTVHGAKGLEAPVVILPDTITMPGGKQKTASIIPAISQTVEGVFPLLLHAPSKAKDCHATAALREANHSDDMHEYQRKLYVALTRAEDELYVTGCLSTKKVPGECWYHQISDAMHALGACQPLDNAHPFMVQENGEAPAAWVLHKEQAVPVSKAEQEEITTQQLLPRWAVMPISIERDATEDEPSQPSAGEAQTAFASDTEQSGKAEDARQRGIWMHRLLQYIPTLEENERDAVAMRYLTQQGLDETTAEPILAQLRAVLHDDRSHRFFGEGSAAEVPVSGVVRGRMIHGRIDRLYVGQGEVAVIDYKTNANPPKKLEEVPQAYLSQLADYAMLVEQIYPDTQLTSYLLWTATASLMEIPVRLLTHHAGLTRAA